MKCKLDVCRIQWINRELLPHYSLFQWNKNESRFATIFNNLDDISATSSNSTSSSIKSNSKKDSNKLSSSQKKPSEISIVKILTQEDKRTTLMIKNIPNKFTKENFLSIFNTKFKGKFDLFLLPTDIKEKKNYGYAFINFVNCFYIINFYYRFNGKKWENTNSVKSCEIVYSKIQGITKMIKHYPIKVMYLKEPRSECSEKEQEEKKESVNALSIAIPVLYKNDFEKYYPKVEIEFDVNEEDVFYVEPNKLLFPPNE